MFESIAPRTRARSGGSTALYFLGQQALATIGPLIASYPIFRVVEMTFLEKSEDGPAVWVWRCAALLLPAVAGLVLGFWIQGAWASAHLVARFVAIIPTLWFIKDFVSTVSTLTFSGAVATTLRDAGGLEMWIGSIFYSIGLYWRFSREMRTDAGRSR